jgi:hypothetical protein
MNVFSILVFLWAIALAGYLFWCLGALARRLGDPKAGWAWIPGWNLVLVPRLARRSAWTALLFLIPLVNIVVWFVQWVEISRRLQQPVWKAFVLAVFPLNLAIYGEFAGLNARRRRSAAVGFPAALIVIMLSGMAWTNYVEAREREAFATIDAAAERGDLPVLERALENWDWEKRANAASAVGRLSPGFRLLVAERVRLLVRGFDDPNRSVRIAAAHALAVLGEYAPPVREIERNPWTGASEEPRSLFEPAFLPLFNNLLLDEDPQVSRAGGRAIRAVGGVRERHMLEQWIASGRPDRYNRRRSP